MRPNGIGDIAWRKVRIVLFGHAGVLMAELCRYHPHGNAAHGQCRSMCMS